VLDENSAWMTGLDARLGKTRARKARYAIEVRLATTMAPRWWTRSCSCEVARVDGRVLERTYPASSRATFKARAMANVAAVGQLVARQLPGYPANSLSSSPTGADG